MRSKTLLTEQQIEQIRHLVNYPIEELKPRSFFRERIAYVEKFDIENGTNIIGKIGEWLSQIEDLEEAITEYETQFAEGEYKRVELKDEYNVEFYEQGRSVPELRLNKNKLVNCIIRDLGLDINNNVRRVVR